LKQAIELFDQILINPKINPFNNLFSKWIDFLYENLPGSKGALETSRYHTAWSGK
jgi:hypothetical protein